METTLTSLSTPVVDVPGAGFPPAGAVDPRIIGTQQTFRVALAALTTPGRIMRLTWEPGFPDRVAGPDRWPAALLLALADHEVSVAVALGDRSDAFAAEVRRWTRAASAAPEAADMVVADAATMDADLPARLRRGSLHYPDDSALLILQVERLSEPDGAGDAVALSLEGPGIDGTVTLGVAGLRDSVLAARDVAVAQYPTGIDLLLVDREGRIAGIPRTTVIAARTGTGGNR